MNLNDLVKLYPNAKPLGQYITFEQKKGYLYIPAQIRRDIDERTDARGVDIYVDPDKTYLVLHITPEGGYTLSGASSGYRLCLYGARDCGIKPGKHQTEFIKDPDGIKIKVDFEAVKGVVKHGAKRHRVSA